MSLIMAESHREIFKLVHDLNTHGWFDWAYVQLASHFYMPRI